MTRGQGDKATRGQGDGGSAVSFSTSPCPRVPVSPGPLVPRSRRAAFTLPEVLAAIVLIGIALPPILKGVSLAMGACDDARRKIEATGLAEAKLAELTVDAMQLLSAGGGSGTFEEHPEYQWESRTLTPDTDLTELTVRVTWTARGSPRVIEMSTLVFTGTTGTSSTDGTETAGGGA